MAAIRDQDANFVGDFPVLVTSLASHLEVAVHGLFALLLVLVQVAELVLPRDLPNLLEELAAVEDNTGADQVVAVRVDETGRKEVEIVFDAAGFYTPGSVQSANAPGRSLRRARGDVPMVCPAL